MIYKVVVASSVDELEKRINRMLETQWKLQGGIAIGIPNALTDGAGKIIHDDAIINVTGIENNIVFCQAMIKM
jgi:hypothetical protein